MSMELNSKRGIFYERAGVVSYSTLSGLGKILHHHTTGCTRGKNGDSTRTLEGSNIALTEDTFFEFNSMLVNAFSVFVNKYNSTSPFGQA